jgi:hypothetical protein
MNHKHSRSLKTKKPSKAVRALFYQYLLTKPAKTLLGEHVNQFSPTKTKTKTALIILLIALFITAASANIAHGTTPRISTCDMNGTELYVFAANETMYLMGTGFPPSTTTPSLQSETPTNNGLQSFMESAAALARQLFGTATIHSYAIYVVADQDGWNNGIPIPPRVPGTTQQVTTDPSGNIQPTPIWDAPLTPGGYDIVVDVNNNGRYDVTVDALMKARIDACPTQHYGVLVLPVPEYWLGTAIGLTSFFAALCLFRLTKNRRSTKSNHNS